MKKGDKVLIKQAHSYLGIDKRNTPGKVVNILPMGAVQVQIMIGRIITFLPHELKKAPK